MLLYLNEYTKQIIAFNEHITHEESEQYTDGVSCIWVDGLTIEIPEHEENQRLEMYFNGETVDYIVSDIETEIDKTEVINSLIEETHATTQIVADDNTINMDMLIELMDKVDLIIDHLGL